jgi:gamma-glutamyltranspeptidase/glutathione hydrolase
MIVSTSGALAVRVGALTMKMGGSAADAAIATALSQITLVGGSWNSFAGMLYALYYDAGAGKVYALNAGFNTVAGETDPRTIPRPPTPSGRTAMVGGFMAGIEQLHRKFGKLPRRALFEPAIFLAEDGVPLDSFMAKIIAAKKDVLMRTSEGREIFSGQDGEVLSEGDVLRQPRLAATLKAVADQGASHMYDGAWGRKFVEAVRSEGGHVTMEDMKAYEAEWEEPIGTTYRGHDVFTIPFPEVGAVQLLEGLNLLEMAEVDVATHYSQNAAALFKFIQLARLGYVVTYASSYRPSAGQESPLPWISPQSRIGKQHAKRLWPRFENADWELGLHMELNAPAGESGGEDPEEDASEPEVGGDHSDGIVAVDREGNVAVVIHSINTSLWGSTGLFVDGVSIPDPASFQQGMLAKTPPGTRFPNVVNPAIIMTDGKLLLAAGAIGNALHECMLQHISNVVDYGMTPAESLEEPKFWGPMWGGAAADYEVQGVDRGAFGPDVLSGVRELGQALRELEDSERKRRVSYWVGVRLNPETGELNGAVSNDFNGTVEIGP